MDNKLKRSRSLSKIPQYCRSASSSRFSSKDTEKRPTASGYGLQRSSSSTSLKKPSYLAPGTAKSSLSRLTPLSWASSRRLGTSSCSARKNTPSFSARKNTPSASGEKKSPFQARGVVKQKRPVDDKKWVHQQFLKLQNFLVNHPQCDTEVVKNLKPLTINSFTYVSNLLFKEIDSRIDINMANYKEMILVHLKALQYPGNLSNSLLKTVNTMHCWPQVVSMLSWLVDLIGTIQRVDAPLDPNHINYKHYRLIEVETEYFAERYQLFNAHEDETLGDQKYTEKLEKIYNVDPESVKKVDDELTRLREVKATQILKIDEQNKKKLAIKNEIQRMRDEMNKYRSDFAQSSTDRRNKIDSLIWMKRDMKNKISAAKIEISSLQETIKHQPCTYEEKKKLLTAIDDLKQRTTLKKEKIEKWKKMKDDYDYKIVEARRDIEREVYRINSSSMEASLHYPELKKLQLKDSGFHTKEFKQEINDIVANKITMEDEISAKVLDFQSSIRILKETVFTLTNSINMCQEEVDKLEVKERKVNEKIDKHRRTLEQIRNDNETKIKLAREKIEKLIKEENDIKLDELGEKKMEEAYCEKHRYLEELQVLIMTFFDNIRAQALEDFPNMLKLRDKLIHLLDQATCDVFQLQQQILDELKLLEPLQNSLQG